MPSGYATRRRWRETLGDDVVLRMNAAGSPRAAGGASDVGEPARRMCAKPGRQHTYLVPGRLTPAVLPSTDLATVWTKAAAHLVCTRPPVFVTFRRSFTVLSATAPSSSRLRAHPSCWFTTSDAPPAALGLRAAFIRRTTSSPIASPTFDGLHIRRAHLLVSLLVIFIS